MPTDASDNLSANFTIDRTYFVCSTKIPISTDGDMRNQKSAFIADKLSEHSKDTLLGFSETFFHGQLIFTIVIYSA